MNREELFDKHLRGELSGEEAAELKRLLASDSQNGRAFVEHVSDTTLLVRVGSQIQSSAQNENVVPLFSAESSASPPAQNATKLRTARSARFAQWAALAACLIALGVVTISLHRKPPISPTPPVPPRVAEVTVTGAGVLVARDAARLEGATIELMAGDIITAPTNGTAVIAYAHESTRIEIQPGSVLVFGDAARGKRFELRRGIMRARVSPQPSGQRLSVKTALARATVLGTDFVMRADAGATKLEVLEGKVEFASRANGLKVKVKAGFAATLTADAPASVMPLCSSNAILRECRGTNGSSDWLENK